MTTFWASIFGFITVVIGILGGIFGHKLGTKDKEKDVALAKELAEKETRQKIAGETAEAAKQAKAEASSSRDISDAQAQAVSAHGDDALNQALKDQGALRD